MEPTRRASRPNARRAAGVRVACALLVAALVAPAAATAQERRAGGALRAFNVTWDVVMVRPWAALALVAGGILFVPAAALSAPNGRDTIIEAWERFVIGPGEHLWGRPLGEF